MKEQKTGIAASWRRNLTKGMVPNGLPPGVYSNAEWLSYSIITYENALKSIDLPSNTQVEIDRLSIAIYLSAFYIFLNGNPEVVFDIIKYIPDESSRHLYNFIDVVRSILPLPEHIKAASLKALEKWLLENINKIYWDREAEVYMLKG